MNWEEFVRKITSRKLWVAITGFVTGLLIFRGHSENEAAQIGALIMSGASVVAYIFGEGLIDASAAGADHYWMDATEEMHPPEEDEND